jgi:hypothetical protein
MKLQRLPDWHGRLAVTLLVRLLLVGLKALFMSHSKALGLPSTSGCAPRPSAATRRPNRRRLCGRNAHEPHPARLARHHPRPARAGGGFSLRG